jgi:flagellar motor switch protein FliN/FliY
VTQETLQAQPEFTTLSAPSALADAAPAVPGNLEAFAAGLCEGAGPALTTLLNRQVSARVAGVRASNLTDLLRDVPLPWVLVEVSYQRGATGGHLMVFPKAEAVKIGVSLSGEDATEGELSPTHADALKDAINQLLAGAGPTLMPLFHRAVSFSSANVKVVEGVEGIPKALREPFWLIHASAQGDAFVFPVRLTVDRALGAQITALGAEPLPSSLEPGRVEPASGKIDMILDISLPIAVELGRARMLIQDILKLAPGSVIELDKSAGDPVDLYINDRPIARGEVVVIDENFGVRLTSIVTASERIKTLR